jgi:hypothetical protein
MRASWYPAGSGWGGVHFTDAASGAGCEVLQEQSEGAAVIRAAWAGGKNTAVVPGGWCGDGPCPGGRPLSMAQQVALDDGHNPARRTSVGPALLRGVPAMFADVGLG